MIVSILRVISLFMWTMCVQETDSTCVKAANDVLVKSLTRENTLIATAWYDLANRLQSNHVVLQRRQDAPRTWLNKQRQLVNSGPRRWIWKVGCGGSSIHKQEHYREKLVAWVAWICIFDGLLDERTNSWSEYSVCIIGGKKDSQIRTLKV